MNLSFAGCGFLGIYHVGVAVCFKRYAPHILLEKISGASAGAIAACCLLCDLPIGGITSDVLRVALEARQRALGPFSPSFNIQSLLLEGLERFLPEDAHLRVNGKLHISLTRAYDGKNVIVSQFNSREDLLQALLATAFVPIFSGMMPPKFHGVRYMDGGFSDNLPVIDENTITVSPFCGESDICPRDTSSQLFHVNVANTSIELSKQNLYRFTKILFPPDPEILSNMCRQGFDDALRFLQRNNLINCTRCLAVQSTFVVSDTLKESVEYDPECQECKEHRQESLAANLPEQVMKIFQDAIDSANKGLFNWLFKHRSMKLLTLISLPYIVPVDFVCATITKIIKNTPNLTQSLWDMTKFFMDQVKYIFNDLDIQHNSISCEVEVSNCGDEEEKVVQKKKKKYNFTLNLEKEAESGNLKIPQKIISRHSSLSNLKVKKSEDNPSTSSDVDAFDHILQMTSQHDPLMDFYYMDANKQMKVTEIYDVTEAESNSIFTQEEKENNENLQFDDDLEEPLITSTWSSNDDEDIYNNLQYLSDEDPLSGNLFSDPESEWATADSETFGTSILESSEQVNMESNSSNSIPKSMPESEQSTIPRASSYHVITNIDDLDLEDRP